MSSSSFPRDLHRPEIHEEDCPRAGLINDGDTLGTPCTCSEDVPCPCRCHDLGESQVGDPEFGPDDCCDFAG